MLRNSKSITNRSQIRKSIYCFPPKSRNLHANFSETNYISLQPNCIKSKSLRETQQFHAQTLVNSLLSDTHLANLTIEFYLKCNEPEFACRTFEEMPNRNSNSWAQIISSYSKNKQAMEALQFFRAMHQQQCDPNRSSLISALNSCGELSKILQGKQLHSQIVKRISPCDIIFGNVLIDFYSKCGELSEARRAFDEILEKDLVSWTSMLSGYAQSGQSKNAWEFFALMNGQSMGFSHYAFSVTAKACAELKQAKAGEELHCLVIRTGFEFHLFVASALLDMYSKFGMIICARKIFDSMIEPNVVSWTSMITGYVQIDEGEEALDLFRYQIRAGIKPDAFSLSSILAGCANVPALEFGKQVHALVVKFGFSSQVFAGNSLIGMYSKCGCLSDARRTHEAMSERDVVTWTSLIAGHAQHGLGAEALQIFEHMKSANVKPNSVTFVSLLSACSRSGMVEEGIRYFESMDREYGIKAREEHYTCMVDLLARAGQVKEAEEFIKDMPFEPSASTWSALLGGCRATGEIRLGLKCAEELFTLEPKSASNHVLLANMYAAQERWEEMGRIRGLMKEKGLKKESGYSWIEVGMEVSVFGVGDNMHPQSDLIHEMLYYLSIEMERGNSYCHLV